ncbi:MULTISPECIES: PadR family transcriptional regulator [unclassified Streptomyces]|uniref:PadR family transcriptional regulator n=1 Tax=unclassified Streptomyces TaxID=2593676 RepID=UPI001BEAB60E|nr:MULTISPECIES: PadR family transcriptional regulator [unclassified Streptomyces]MBT2407778.1 PadR family transcriptional regulator [Streptomyces sp. ISL-21]MBT2456709.1 PadR family transcriptional regulator [Streptomyces sp. ISL-86]MBT2613783.1 PadR family transcriptional regulator [Streptomyces sp. ISL-87]
MTSSQTSKKQELKKQDLPPTAWAVLGLLSFPGERTGYELKKWTDSSLRFFYWSPAISQIYAELRRLEELGYAASARSGPEEARAKRRYTITGAGREALAGWAADTADAGPPVLKHGLLLRIWLGHLAEPERLRAMVEEHLERTRGELAAVRKAMEHAGEVPEWAFPALALRWSERQHLAELELAEALLADLAGLSPAAEPGRQAGGDAPTPG